MNIRTLLLLLTLCALCRTAAAQYCPPNLDFETGTFDGWQCSTGSTRVNGGKNEILLSPSAPAAGRHEIISGPITLKDPYGGFPQLCPYGGKYSVKLGNTGTGAQAEGLSYTFQVPNSVDTFSFTYFYAVVFQDPMHNAYEQPRFFVTAYDVATGELINCASYDYIATGGIPGFKTSALYPDVLYKEWSPVSIQFAGLANKTVRLEFKTADCTLGGHFGYAYVDVSSGCSNILATAPYCAETNSIILNAPYGFQSYTWYSQDYSKVIGNAQSVTLSPPPATAGMFPVDVVPYPGYGCRDTAYAVVTPLPVPPLPAADSEYAYCQYQGAGVLTATAEPGNDLLWYTMEAGGIGSANAPVPVTTRSGVFYYYVSQKVLFGCESFRRRIRVTVSPTPIAAFIFNTDRQCEHGNKFLLTSTSANLNDAQYTWTLGDGKTVTSPDSVTSYTYARYGTYTVNLKVENAHACVAQKTSQVTVYPSPVASFSFPSLLCEKETPVLLKDVSSVTGNSLSRITGWWWSIDGKTTSTQNPAPFIANTPGRLPVKLVVMSNQGCPSDTNLQNLTVRYRPAAAFGYGQPLCNNETVRFTNTSSLPAAASPEYVNKWSWQLDNTPYTSKDLSLYLPAGPHTVRLISESNWGCRSLPADSVLTIYPKPYIRLAISDSCVFRTIRYSAGDSLKTVAKWLWDFGTGAREGSAVMTRSYSTEGYRPVVLVGQTIYGCKDTVIRPFRIFDNKAFAGRDTLAAMDEPVQLNAHGGAGVAYTWSPADDLNDATLENPVAKGTVNRLYRLDALTREGCDSHSQIMITRYKGPDIYIPNAFTPNKDGHNDALRVLPVGIRRFDYMAVYNRWGELLYKTTDYRNGWDGTFRGQQMDAGTYVAIAQALDYNGKIMVKKTPVTLIR